MRVSLPACLPSKGASIQINTDYISFDNMLEPSFKMMNMMLNETKIPGKSITRRKRPKQENKGRSARKQEIKSYEML